MYYIGFDIGKVNDYSAFVSALQIPIPEPSKFVEGDPARDDERLRLINQYRIRQIERPELGVSYYDQVDRLVEITSHPDIRAVGFCVVVDVTGVGRAVLEMVEEAGVQNIVPVLITSGNDVTFDEETGIWHVPKKEIISVLQVVIQGRRMKFSKHLPLAGTFEKELLAFKAKVTKKGNDQYEAWRARDHDDIVLAGGIALWKGEYDSGFSRTFTQARAEQKRRTEHAKYDWLRG